jgi:hypothetical protein
MARMDARDEAWRERPGRSEHGDGCAALRGPPLGLSQLQREMIESNFANAFRG